MEVIDMHCDTIYKLCNSKNEINLKKNELSVDIEKLKKANSKAQFFALYIDKGDLNNKSSLKTCLNMLDRFYNEIEKNKESICLARNYKELKKNNNQGKISAFLTIEGGEALEGDIYNLRNFYRLGIRLITLTWNYKNEIGYPSFKKEYKNKGLTSFGIDVVEEMNRLGMIIDVSHLSDAGFYNISKYSKKPFVASHSNCRSITSHGRNLTDNMIKILSEKGGVMGLNFSSDFLGKTPISRIDDMITHIKHMKNVGGIDCIGLGTDFDGISCKLEIKDISHIEKLIYALRKNGFSESEVEKICYKNVERLIKDVLK